MLLIKLRMYRCGSKALQRTICSSAIRHQEKEASSSAETAKDFRSGTNVHANEMKQHKARCAKMYSSNRPNAVLELFWRDAPSFSRKILHN